MPGYGEEYDEEEVRCFEQFGVSWWLLLTSFVGCIINVSSLLGVKGGRGNTVYAASKAGIIGSTIFNV
jgi:NAD(P)-dependent dehydrogenase (short-subunit alcohol dehydrogenase family)